MTKCSSILGLLLLPWTGMAQSDFKVSAETGLEPVAAPKAEKAEPQAKATTEAKPGTVITTSSKDSKTTFDEASRVAVFEGDVMVKDPQFTLTCGKLTAYLKKAAAKSGSNSNTETASAPAAEAKGPGGGLDRAVAEGNVLIEQDKVDAANGEVTHYVGRGAKADYNAVTGDLTLTGRPQIQQGLSRHFATSDETVMVLNRAGHLTTTGPAEMDIQPQGDLKSTDHKSKRRPQ